MTVGDKQVGYKNVG